MKAENRKTVRKDLRLLLQPGQNGVSGKTQKSKEAIYHRAMKKVGRIFKTMAGRALFADLELANGHLTPRARVLTNPLPFDDAGPNPRFSVHPGPGSI